MYQHPGVYIEHVPSGLLSVEAASTSVAAFIGHVPRGAHVTADEGEPEFISSTSQFARKFGPLGDTGGGVRDLTDQPDHFGLAVNAFFANGGSKAYIVPIGAGDGVAATASLANPANPAKAFYFSAASAGEWANGLVVWLELEVDDAHDPLASTYSVTLGLPDEDGEIDVELERFASVTMQEGSSRFLVNQLRSSELVKVGHKDIVAAGPGVVQALLSGDLSGFDPTTISDGDQIRIQFSGDISTSADVTFDGTATSLADLAAQIQAGVPGQSNSALRKDFTCRVTRDRRLLLIPGQTPGVKNGATVVASATATKLKLEGGDEQSLDYPSKSLFAQGTNHGTPNTNAYRVALERLRNYRDVSIVLLPGQVWAAGGDNTAIEAAITHAEFMQNRLVLVDPPRSTGNARLTTPTNVKAQGFPTSPYAVLYYPWLTVPNPHYDPDTAANVPKTFDVPPGAFAAGLWARIDGARGVWKAPAGLEATVRGAIAPNVLIGNDLQDNLNSWGVNCIRSIIGPNVIWGARTLATRSKPEFRYVSVRRTQSMIGESLYRALQSVVFEPNDYRLWASLRAAAEDFMGGLHRAGAFQGEKASDAYYVRCGLDSTMEQSDIDAGIVRLVVGFAALKPAEFVVVQIKQIVRRPG